MKNILIPATFEDDTLHAIKNAISHPAATPKRIVLMYPIPMPDGFAAAEFIRKSHYQLTPAQSLVLEKCHKAVNAVAGCHLEMRTQVGVTAPLLKNLFDFLNISLIIIPASYKAEKSKLHRRCHEILLKYKCPVLQLTAESGEARTANAMYLENKRGSLGIQELLQLVNGQFNFRIVSHADITETQSPDELAGYLSEAIEKNNIDLLVETRAVNKRRKSYKGSNINELLGLPVLSINEDTIKA